MCKQKILIWIEHVFEDKQHRLSRVTMIDIGTL